MSHGIVGYPGGYIVGFYRPRRIPRDPMRPPWDMRRGTRYCMNIPLDMFMVYHIPWDIPSEPPCDIPWNGEVSHEGCRRCQCMVWCEYRRWVLCFPQTRVLCMRYRALHVRNITIFNTWIVRYPPYRSAAFGFRSVIGDSLLGIIGDTIYSSSKSVNTELF